MEIGGRLRLIAAAWLRMQGGRVVIERGWHGERRAQAATLIELKVAIQIIWVVVEDIDEVG